MPPNAVENNFCFVLYPPGKRFINLWDAVLEPAIITSGMRALRGADIYGRYDNLMDGICKHILNARLIVAVLDEQSLSVVYELGLAHAAKKHVIILLEEGKAVPEVFSYLSLLRYDPEDFPGARKELSRRILAASGAPEEDLFPDLPIRSPAEWEEYQYLKLTRKTLTIKVTPKNCSIFFNNRLLGASPQTIRVNPDAKRNVVSVTAIGQFDYYKILTAEDINNQELEIYLEQRDASKYPTWVNKWLKLRREDPDSLVLSRAIGYYLTDQSDLDAAREEAQFCIFKAPNWFGGYNLLGIIETRCFNYDKAIEYFEKVGELNPNDYLVSYNIACVKTLKEVYQEALDSLKKIAETPSLHDSIKEIYKHHSRPYFFEEDADLDPLRRHADYKDRFAAIINQLVAIVESPDPPLIIESSQDTFSAPETPKPLPYAVKRIEVKAFQCIRYLTVADLPIDSRWIFITGDNADGKTSLLQALAIGLCGAQDADNVLNNPECVIDIEVKKPEQSLIRHFYWKEDHWRTENGQSREVIEPCMHIVGYGPARLDIQGEMSLDKERSQNGPLHSLLQQQGNLLNIESWLKNQELESRKAVDYAISQRKKNVMNLLANLMPNVDEIIMDGSQIKYKEKGFVVEAHHLSAGHKSILAMIGDMMIRLFERQPGIVNPADLRGIVLIDELDVHLHPRWQKRMPTLLSDTFPNIQFIASTHSVIPFLGAPPGSVFLKVTRNEEHGTTAERLDIDVTKLLPNALLTSPLFDLDDISSSHKASLEEVNTDDDYRSIEWRRQRNERLRQALQTIGTPE
jgi:tetratricopeptide (TPR) repeat protein/predicted ATPase